MTYHPALTRMRQSPPPVWRQIADTLRAAIDDHTFTPGSALPSEAELASRHGCSRPTVRRALAALAADGLLTAAHGQGTFIRTIDDPGSFAAAELIAALEQAWAAIRTHHPEVPPAVMVVASGTSGGTPRWGHYAALRWQHGNDRLPEVLISGEGLQRPAPAVLGTQLHEGAHALADARGIKDTSRQGRWHNRLFADHAEELGLTAEKDSRTGWSTTTITDDTARRYSDQIDAIARAQAGAWRRAEPVKDPGEKKNNNPPPCVCDCPRRIRVATSVLDLGPITCGVCGADFTPDTDEQDDSS